MSEQATRENPKILHISADYPDPIAPQKTRVIKRLRDLVDGQFDQYVISLNRMDGGLLRPRSNPHIIAERRPFCDGLAITYKAPAKGLWHKLQLERLADSLLESIAGPAQPDLIIGHKLTVEGIVVARIAARLGIPYAIMVQGNTDTKITALRPDLRFTFRRILDGASHVFCMAPWAWSRLQTLLGPRAVKPAFLPAPTDLDQPISPQRGNGEIVSAFHLDTWRTKGFATLVRAAGQLGEECPPIAVLGGGRDLAMARCERLATSTASIRLEGAIPHDDLPHRLNRASGFVLPSRRESFGLVFIEALFAGLPIIYPRGAAIDGYFDDMPFAIQTDAGNPSAIARAISYLLAHEEALKAELKRWQSSDHAHTFTRAHIGSRFAEGLCASIAPA